MRGSTSLVLLIIVVVAIIFLISSAFVLDETEQAIITQFGKPIGEPIVEAGLHFKAPFIQKVVVFDKRILEWDGAPQELPTKDNKFIHIDTFARWKISNALTFYKSLRNETTAYSRLDDLLDGAVRDEIAVHILQEIVRNSDRPMLAPEVEEIGARDIDTVRIKKVAVEGARDEITSTILTNVSEKLASLDLGIEVIDLKIKRIDYNPAVQENVFNRMISEQKRIAEKYRAIGKGERERILGKQDQRKKEILSEAYLRSQEIRGRGDGQAIKIYASAYDRSEDARDFYKFLRTLDVYKSTIDSSTTFILSTGSDYLRYLRSPR